MAKWPARNLVGGSACHKVLGQADGDHPRAFSAVFQFASLFSHVLDVPGDAKPDGGPDCREGFIVVDAAIATAAGPK